jgi:predicted nucleic acid-binding protein
MTSKRKETLYCWDSSVWFAWIKQETCHPLADMELVAGEISNGKASLLVPATVYEEFQLGKCTTEQRDMIERFLLRDNIFQAAQTPAVSRKAAEIIRKSEENGIVTKLNDARIVATAIVFDATVLHTVDSGLIRLSGRDIVDRLWIASPRLISGHRGLF